MGTRRCAYCGGVLLVDKESLAVWTWDGEPVCFACGMSNEQTSRRGWESGYGYPLRVVFLADPLTGIPSFLYRCDLCHELYPNWSVPTDTWRTVPVENQKQLLCIHCFRSVVGVTSEGRLV